MTSRELNSVNVKTVAFLAALLFGILGLIGGILYTIGVFTVGLPIDLPGAMMTVTALLGGFFGGVIYGFVSGAIVAALYNFFAEKIGGVKFEVN